MYNYNNSGIGGQERKLNNANEAIFEIPLNRTMFIERLTNRPNNKYDIITGLQTIEDVFEHFKPSVEVEFSKEENVSINEELQFRSLGDFSKKGIINQSEFLQDLNAESEDLKMLMRQLKSNKVLKAAAENEATKAAFISSLDALIKELKD